MNIIEECERDKMDLDKMNLPIASPPELVQYLRRRGDKGDHWGVLLGSFVVITISNVLRDVQITYSSIYSSFHT